MFSGSCHCGAVAYEADGTPDVAISCNCSICRRKAAILYFLPADRFTLKTDRSAMATYTFNTHRIQHLFCTTCGCAPFAEAAAPDGTPMVAINLNCAEGIDLGTVQIKAYDGASLR